MTDLNYYLSLAYRSEVTTDCYEDGKTYFVARIPDLPGCISSGPTREEAEKNLRDAKSLYLATALEHGFTPPRPSVAPVQEVTTEAWSGSRDRIVVLAHLKGREEAKASRWVPSSAAIAVGRRQSLRAKVAG
jgi:predicted RNase H-like HicB family nuclease